MKDGLKSQIKGIIMIITLISIFTSLCYIYVLCWLGLIAASIIKDSVFGPISLIYLFSGGIVCCVVAAMTMNYIKDYYHKIKVSSII